MKTLSMSLVFLAVFVYLAGAPLRNIPTVLEQPDGSKYHCFMSGDEYYHRAHDSNGFTIIKDLATDWHVYAQKQGPDLVPTALVPGRDDPAARGLTPHLLPDESIIRQKFSNFRGASGDQYGRAPTMGTVNNISIFVRFAGETEFGDATQLYTDMHNSTFVTSMNGYFLEESGNQLNVSSTFYPTNPGSMVLSWQDANPRNFYYPQSPSNPIGYPPGPVLDPDRFGWIRLHTMFANAVNSIAPMVPPGLMIDADGDMQVDNVSFICRGNADAMSALFWPHSWQMNSYAGVPIAMINGAQAVDYNFNLQFADPLYIGYGGGIDAALICHEFSHTMGFPDLYHYVIDGVNPCGYWDLMDTCYQNPQHHLAYMKMKYGGWFTTVPALPASGACTLNAVAYNPFDCYRYFMPTGEEIWIEYRRAVGNYESRLPYSGLIFYRVDQAYYPWGNGGGPPDEVYVYRPFVSSSPPDGNISWAAFAWEQSQTAFNQFTDPNPFSQSMPGFVAPLNIHSIESNNGPQINFVVGTVIPVIWKGTTDSNWFNPANWSRGAVPTATDFVIIPPVGGWFFCQVQPSGLPAVCQNLRNEHMLSTLPGCMLQVNGNFYSIGRFFQDGTTQVAGNFTIAYWYSGSWLQSTVFPGSQLIIGGNCLFDPGSQIQMQTGQLIFANIGVSPPVNTFTCESFGASLFDLVVNKTGTALHYNSMLAGALVNIWGSLSVTANSTLIINAPHFINISGNLSVAPTGLLQVQDTIVNTFNFVGPPAMQTISINSPNCYLNHVDVQNNAAPMLAGNLDVRGNFSITQGTFIANNNTIFVRGNWTNNMGLGGFQKGTSRVVFNGPLSDQAITVASAAGAPTEDFYILELNKALGSLNMNTAGQIVSCDFYDWTSGMLKVTDGTFSANSLLDNCVKGNFTCNSPGAINLIDATGMGDLAANLVIQGGMIIISSGMAGPAAVSTWGIQSGSVSMSSGSLVFQNCGVNIIPGGGILSTNISGGMVQVNGDFTVFRPEFAPSGGQVWINSAAPVNIAATGGGSFYTLVITAPLANTMAPVQINNFLQVDPASALSVSQNTSVSGNAVLMGALNLTGGICSVAGVVNAGTGGSLTINPGAILESADRIAFTGGSFQSYGAPGNPAIVRGMTGTYWRMITVSGSSVAAKDTEFWNLTGTGVNIAAGVTIDLTADFDYCVFRNGNAGCTFLTVNNSQNLVIDGISFPTGTVEQYNIAKTVNSGSILVNSSSGAFAGPWYEDDTYNLISWSGYNQNLVVQSFSVSIPNPYVVDQVTYNVTVQNIGTDPISTGFNIHLFKNRGTPPGWTETGDYQQACPPLAAGQTYSYGFSGIYSATPGSWTSWLLIDPEGAVRETNETDNRASVGVIWQALPAVQNSALADIGGGTGRISWTYPIWVSRYKVYGSNDPFGTFSYLGSTANLYYDTSLSSAMNFYKITAERDTP